jgi:hypothetical protein
VLAIGRPKTFSHGQGQHEPVGPTCRRPAGAASARQRPRANVHRALAALGARRHRCDAVLHRGGISSNKWGLLSLVVLFFLLIGCLVEASIVFLVVAPMVLPALRILEVSEVHFGIVTVVAMGIGMYTPPVGIALHMIQEHRDPAAGPDADHLRSGTRDLAAATSRVDLLRSSMSSRGPEPAPPMEPNHG